MEQTLPTFEKPWWLSRGVWGGVIAVLSGIAGLLGYAVSDAEQALIADAVVIVAASASSAAGGVLAIIGRIKASRVIAPLTNQSKE
jgi:NADPH-dependent curcumin reductase CurA